MTSQHDIYKALNKTPGRWVNAHTIAKRLGTRPRYSLTRQIRRLGENLSDIQTKKLGSKDMARFLKGKKGLTKQYLGYIAMKRRTPK